MRKILLLLFCLILAGCGNDSEIKDYTNEEIKDYTNEEIEEIKSESDQVYEALDGQILKDSFSNREAYTSLNFYDEGDFDGDFLSNSDIDGKDFGLKEESEKTYNRSEIHKSVFSGKFTLGNQIEEGIYKLSLEDYTINNQTGPDEEIKYQTWVDFAKGLNKDDEYILYLKGAVLDDYLLENNQYSQEEIQIQAHDEDVNNEENHDHEDDNHNHKEDYRAYSIIIYNKSQKLIFTSHDKWAQTYHNH